MLSWISVLALKGLIVMFGRVPFLVSFGLATLVGDVLFFVGFKRRTVLRNLDYIYGETITSAEKRRIARASTRNIARMAVELMRASNPRTRRTQALRVSFDRPDVMLACDADPRGTIFVVAHSGNIDLPAVWWTETRSRKLSVVMKPFENRRFNDFLVSTREDYGYGVISTKDAGAIDAMNALLARGEAMCILPDQNARGRGVSVEFLGKRASTYKGAAATALRNPAARVVVCVPQRVSGRPDHLVRVQEVTGFVPTGNHDDDVKALTQEFCTIMGRAIRKNPESYLWHHQRWGRIKPSEIDHGDRSSARGHHR